PGPCHKDYTRFVVILVLHLQPVCLDSVAQELNYKRIVVLELDFDGLAVPDDLREETLESPSILAPTLYTLWRMAKDAAQHVIDHFPGTVDPTAADLGGNELHHPPERLAPGPGNSHDRPFDQGQSLASLVSLVGLVSLCSLARSRQVVRPQQPQQVIQL